MSMQLETSPGGVDHPATESSWVTHPWVGAGGGRPRFALTGGPNDDWPRFLELVQRAESLNFDAYWMADHPVRRPGCWTTLAALAASTQRIRLGTLVNCVYYRTPFELARAAADVDRMSNGRVIVGLGAGDDVREFAQIGIAMPSAKERLNAVEATIQSVRRLWGNTTTPPNIETLRPGPVQSPRIPILIAGGGPRSLRLAAQYADAVNLIPVSDPKAVLRGGAVDTVSAAALAARLAHPQNQGPSFGRSPSSMLWSFMVPVVLADSSSRLADKLNSISEHRRRFLPFAITGTPEQVVDTYVSLTKQGVQYFIAALMDDDGETLELLAAHVWPALEASISRPSDGASR